MLWLAKLKLVFFTFCSAVLLVSCGFVQSKIEDYSLSIRDYTFEMVNNDSLFSALFVKYPSDSSKYAELRKTIAEFERRSNEEVKLLDSIDKYGGWFKNKGAVMNEHFKSNNTKRKFNSLKDKIRYTALPLDNSIDTLDFIIEPLRIGGGGLPVRLQRMYFQSCAAEAKEMERNILLKKLSSISKNEQ